MKQVTTRTAPEPGSELTLAELIPQVMKWANHDDQLVKRKSIHDHSILITSHPRDGLPLFSLNAVLLNYPGIAVPYLPLVVINQPTNSAAKTVSFHPFQTISQHFSTFSTSPKPSCHFPNFQFPRSPINPRQFAQSNVPLRQGASEMSDYVVPLFHIHSTAPR